MKQYWFINVGLVLSFGVLAAAVARLMVIRHGYYESLSRDNRIVENIIPAARGVITDRKGRVVATSKYRYSLIDGSSQLYEETDSHNSEKLVGGDYKVETKRQYPYGESVGMITGYVGKAGDAEIKGDSCQNKLGPDGLVGRGGLEENFDCLLRGKIGRRLIEVDAKGKYLRELGSEMPTDGEKITTTIDAYWQEKIYKMIEGKKAVVIISQPKTGEILAMVSSPAFNPNVFSYDVDSQMIKKYLGDEANLPMLNRAIAGRYHPGSVFKIILATGGLESGVIKKTDTIEDTGVIKIGNYSYNNWLYLKSGGTDGMVDLVKAIKRSNDIYFYRLGEKLGVDRIKEWAVRYGYGQKTGVELPTEVAGIVPDEKWKIENKGERWFLGNTYHLSIGQGDLGVTPLQVNQMTNVVANGGKRCKPTLIKNGKSNCVDLGINKETINTIIEGMKAACKSGGTAWPLFNFKTTLACKTGTAEVGDGSSDTQAWLTAFAPADNPQISITVLVERGGEGSDVAAPIVGDILKEWFNEPDTKIPRYDKNKKVIYGE